MGSPADLVRAARRAGVDDERILAAIAAIPRAAFVPAGHAADEAYADRPLPIPHGQVTTQPALSAVMIAGLGLRGSEEVLEIGNGIGNAVVAAGDGTEGYSARAPMTRFSSLRRFRRYHPRWSASCGLGGALSSLSGQAGARRSCSSNGGQKG